jgi:hypothetical protein
VTDAVSDTLKRHQKLHTVDGRKESRRIAKRLKRSRTDTHPDAPQPDRPTESYIDHSPIQEVVLPQFCYDTLVTWESSSFDPTLANAVYTNPEYVALGSYFDETFPTLEEGSIESAGSDSTIDPEALWVQQ